MTKRFCMPLGSFSRLLWCVCTSFLALSVRGESDQRHELGSVQISTEEPVYTLSFTNPEKKKDKGKQTVVLNNIAIEYPMHPVYIKSGETMHTTTLQYVMCHEDQCKGSRGSDCNVETCYERHTQNAEGYQKIFDHLKALVPENEFFKANTTTYDPLTTFHSCQYKYGNSDKDTDPNEHCFYGMCCYKLLKVQPDLNNTRPVYQFSAPKLSVVFTVGETSLNLKVGEQGEFQLNQNKITVKVKNIAGQMKTNPIQENWYIVQTGEKQHRIGPGSEPGKPQSGTLGEVQTLSDGTLVYLPPLDKNGAYDLVQSPAYNTFQVLESLSHFRVDQNPGQLVKLSYKNFSATTDSLGIELSFESSVKYQMSYYVGSGQTNRLFLTLLALCVLAHHRFL